MVPIFSGNIGACVSCITEETVTWDPITKSSALSGIERGLF